MIKMNLKNINALKEKMDHIKKMNWIESKFNGTGAGGLTFEKLIGKEIENFEIPDYHGIEIKTKSETDHHPIRLFNATPDSYLFEIKRIYNTYGFTNDKNVKVFYLSITNNKTVIIKNRFFFKLIINRKKQKVILNIFDKLSGEVDNDISWSFNLLKEKLERKLSLLALVNVRKKQNNNQSYFKYTNIKFFKLKDPNLLIKLIEDGTITISFNITERYNKYNEKIIYDHGTSFAIKKQDLNKLFKQIV